MAGTKKSIFVDEKGEFLSYPVSEIAQQGVAAMTTTDMVSISQVLAQSNRKLRTRQEIYNRWHYMMGDPVIHAALGLHVTQSLGGHETTGDVVFFDANPEITPAEQSVLEDLQENVLPLLNQAAYQLCFNGVGYGDAYVRVYSAAQTGVQAIDYSDFYLPPLVQPFERGGQTVGYQVAVEGKTLVNLSAMQVARLKMPRLSFLPQTRVQYNHWLQSVAEDDIDAIKPLPSTVGGSFLEAAEKPFMLLQTALTGLTSSRILDSLRESMLGLNMTDMTKDQQDEFLRRVAEMLRKSKQRTADAIAEGKPIVENIFHLIPTSKEKQLYSIDAGGVKNAGNNPYSVEDVMFYAKLLAGALGLDLSLLGFSELLSGGLGDGGFFRVSAQAGMKSRLIRQAFTGLCNHVVDIHCQTKYGGVFPKGKRPYQVVFIGANSALEREMQDTRERKAMASGSVVQVMQQMKELGADEKVMAHFLNDQMGMDEDDAAIYAKLMSADASGQGDEYDE